MNRKKAAGNNGKNEMVRKDCHQSPNAEHGMQSTAKMGINH